ncbi:teleost multiple tissue opsin a [Tachysurus ichikawai]
MNNKQPELNVCQMELSLLRMRNRAYVSFLSAAHLLFCFLKIQVLKVSRLRTSTSQKREHRVLFMVITMVLCYLLCWLPYGIMALVATFGVPGLVTAEASIVPSILAKTSTVINPIIYIFMNKQFNRCFRSLLKCETPQQSSVLKSWSKANKPKRCLDNNLDLMTGSGDHRSAAVSSSKSNKQPPSTASPGRPALSLVAHYNGSF